MSAYEQQRLARLARNLEVMRSMGLNTDPPAGSAPPPPPVSASAAAARKRRARYQDDDDEEEEDDDDDEEEVETKRAKLVLPDELRRRSSRVADLPKPVYFPSARGGSGAAASAVEVILREPSQRVRKPVVLYGADDNDSNDSNDDDDEEDAPSSVSCHLLDAAVDPDVDVGHLFVPPAGVGAYKEYVITSLAEPKTVKPVFNRYSGIQAFRNCVVLFANVGSSSTAPSATAGAHRAEYNNAFFVDDERGVVEMDWFAAARTPHALIHRLTRQDDTVYLFLRVEGEPYLCVGSVGVGMVAAKGGGEAHEAEAEATAGRKFRLTLTTGHDHVLMRNDDFKQRLMRLVRWPGAATG